MYPLKEQQNPDKHISQAYSLLLCHYSIAIVRAAYRN